jgi:hypothetical protein
MKQHWIYEPVIPPKTTNLSIVHEGSAEKESRKIYIFEESLDFHGKRDVYLQ